METWLLPYSGYHGNVAAVVSSGYHGYEASAVPTLVTLVTWQLLYFCNHGDIDSTAAWLPW